MDNQFDTLKRQATKLERSLEDKVARYHQVCDVMCCVSVSFGLYGNIS